MHPKVFYAIGLFLPLAIPAYSWQVFGRDELDVWASWNLTILIVASVPYFFMSFGLVWYITGAQTARELRSNLVMVPVLLALGYFVLSLFTGEPKGIVLITGGTFVFGGVYMALLHGLCIVSHKAGLVRSFPQRDVL